MLGAGTITVLSLREDDVVTLPSGRSHTAATVIIDAHADMLEVATVQVTPATGATDTVVYSP